MKTIETVTNVLTQLSGIDPECWAEDITEQIREDEVNDMCRLLRRVDIAQALGSPAPTLTELMDMLQRGEHRR